MDVRKTLSVAFFGLMMSMAVAGCSTSAPLSDRQSLGLVDTASRETAKQALASYNIDASVGALRPGDLVRVKFTLAPELDTEQRVLPSGRLSLPYIGLLEVYGKSIETITKELRTAYAAHLNQPDISVTILEYARPLPSPKIYVVGAVNDAGAFDIDAPITFIEALALAGGLDRGAKRDSLAVIRLEDGEFVASLYQSKSILLGQTDRPLKIGYLMPGDIVFVPPSRLSSASEISQQVQQLIGFSGYSGNFGFRFREFDGL